MFGHTMNWMAKKADIRKLEHIFAGIINFSFKIEQKKSQQILSNAILTVSNFHALLH